MTGSDNRNDAMTSNDSPVQRSFVDADGMRWRVYEQPTSDYDRRRQSLIFASETAVRRVRDFPANWTDLSDDELTALSWNA
ncbi:MAG: hypothetical protein ABJE47_22420 [bacterium]